MSQPAFEARHLALNLLFEVFNRHHALDNALDHAYREPRVKALDPRDRAFARLLVMTVIRRLGEIDLVLDEFLDHYPEDHTKTLKHILRMGVAQMLFLDVPAHAAVGTAVDLVEKVGREQLKALANGVLRRVSDNDCRRAKTILKEKAHPSFNFPKWLRKGWNKDYAKGPRQEMFEAVKEVPPLDLTVKSDPKGWAARLDGEVLPTGSVRLHRTERVELLDGFADGEWWVQDAAAALPVRLFGNVESKHVLDMCAARLVAFIS